MIALAARHTGVMLSSARTPDLPAFTRNRVPQIIAALYAVVWIWAAIDPTSRSDWLLENLLVVAGVAFAAWLYHQRLLSDVSSILTAVFLALHTVGAHYTYSLVPFGDWLKEVLGLERNHYDRIIHFGFGLLITYPVRELLLRRKIAPPKWAGLTAFAFIATASGFYELMEWLSAVIVAPDLGNAFLGTQGDEFDSQKDHAMAVVGSIVALAATRILEKSPDTRAA